MSSAPLCSSARGCGAAASSARAPIVVARRAFGRARLPAQPSRAQASAAPSTTAARPSPTSSSVSPSPPSAPAPASSYAGRTRASFLSSLQHINPAFAGISSEAQFMGLLEQLTEAGKLPLPLLAQWRDFYESYRGAVVGSGAPGAGEELAARVQATIADTVFNQMAPGNAYEFPSAHARLLEPYDYYAFGQRYVGSLVDFEASVLGRPDRWAAVAAQLAAGDNVVLLANHQTEADPGVFAHMLAAGHPELAERVCYVAGDRVVTDPLCKPFSMGRNLFCVHSKRHMGGVEPAVRAARMETNRRTLVAMQRALNAGGCLLWIAPSGGRDRPDAESGVWTPDRWDPAAVELMRSLAARAKPRAHLYPMAMYSWPVMPPPRAVEAAVGERRVTAYSGVGISLCEELTDAELAAPPRDAAPEVKEAAARGLAEGAQRRVAEEYRLLERAILDPAARAAEPEVWAQPFLVPASSD